MRGAVSPWRLTALCHMRDTEGREWGRLKRSQSGREAYENDGKDCEIGPKRGMSGRQQGEDREV